MNALMVSALVGYVDEMGLSVPVTVQETVSEMEAKKAGPKPCSRVMKISVTFSEEGMVLRFAG